MCNYLKLESIVLFCLVAFLSGCGGSGSGSPQEPQPPPTPTISVDVGVKQLIFSWPVVADRRWEASYYKLLENPDGQSGFTQVGDDIPAEMGSVRRDIAVHLFDFASALYILEACNNYLCSRSTEINVINGMLDAVGYFKASNTGRDDEFGSAVALSNDGSVLAVGACVESSSAIGIDGNQNDNSANASGAVYIFQHDGISWSQSAFVKASNTGTGDCFGNAVALSGDGMTLVVGAPGEDSNATGINGGQSDESARNSGAVFVFHSDGIRWSQQAYIKSSNTGLNDDFGTAVALSDDGTTLAVGAPGESSDAAGINGDQSNDSAPGAGAVYVFRFDDSAWYQQVYVKASNPDQGDFFGWPSLSLGADGDVLVVGAGSEDGNGTGVNGDQENDLANDSGAVYVFRYDGSIWSQQAYLKASNTGVGDRFGWAHALSENGTYLAIGSPHEDSNAIGIDGDQNNDLAEWAGAVYLFRYDGNDWSQQNYIKASNTDDTDFFGDAVALSEDGTMLAVGASGETGGARGVNGDQNDSSILFAGAVYIYSRSSETWSQQAYVKASNTGASDEFGREISLSADGSALAVGALKERSSSTGIGGDQEDDSAYHSGAAYLY